MSERWSIYIDLEGFSALWQQEDQILWSLGELMRAVFRVGKNCFPNAPDRLFAHQFGDGFLIVSDFHESSLERCVAIAVALMRHVASTGRLARASIAEGELSDIQGCYPKEVLACLEGDHTVSLEMGLMTIGPVMGTALIRAVNVDKRGPRGPLLLAESSKRDRIGAAAIYRSVENNLISIDWVHLDSSLVREIQSRGQLTAPSPVELEQMIGRYLRDQQALSDEWRASVKDLLGVLPAERA